ncbi:hypothetical protein [Hymenobacter sp. YC55]|uniref:hypothetical protein n=1 Tax=Hymenobacter sp. YC55 TaxID=3034019 RepID=UPI0023F72C7E|nr:hypothetical protein [Hymenobacter sp. YC55]MDF7810689.1 hypothetical protein [Hymenobacter sp. YC55]
MTYFSDLPARLARVEEAVPVLTDEAGQVMPVVSQDDLSDLRESVTGQKARPPKGIAWRMSNNQSARRLDALEPTVAAMFEVLTEQMGPQMLLLAAQAQETQATVEAEQVKLEANTLADQAKDAWLALINATATQAKADAAVAKAEATAAKSATTAQALALSAAQTETATAKAKADAAQLKADAAMTKAEAAQALAASATATAATAQASAATAINNAAAASSQATAAQTTATAAQTNLDAFKERFRSKRQTTPPIAVGGTVLVTVQWDKPFADDKYNTFLMIEGAGQTIKYKSHTKEAVVGEVSNLLGLNVLAGAGIINAQALHD